MSVDAKPFKAKTHRLIASRWPTIGVFDDCMDAEAVEAAIALETLTNDRLANVGILNAIPKDEWAVGPGATVAMAAFLHPNPGRFNSAEIGAWYAALDIQTAVAETMHHHERRLRASAAAFPALIQMRELVSSPAATLVDIRGEEEARSELYAGENYGASSAFGEAVRREGDDGIWYSSVRRSGGQNVVIYKPRLLVPVLQGDHYEYTWDAHGNSNAYKLTNVA